MDQESPFEGRTFRNHPSVIVGNVSVLLLVCIVFVFVTMDDVTMDMKYVAVGIALLAAAAAYVFYYWWKKTTYTFTDTELNVRVDTLFKKDNHIQYSRLASVNVRRSIINHIFGTSTLTFNVNSSVNSSVPEASLCLTKEIADRLRDDLNQMIFHKGITHQEDLQLKTELRITNGDIILHAVFGQSTYQALFGLVMIIYSVISVLTDNTGGLVIGVVLLLTSEVIPFISVILKYFNYRIYRVGDTITVESGMINNYRSSFNVNKVNSVRVFQPLLARMIGRSMLVGEVVGMAGDDGVPLLCPLKSRSEVDSLFRKILPEFHLESEPVHQPRSALVPMIAVQAVFAVLAVVACYGVYTYAVPQLEEATGLVGNLIMLFIAAVAVLVPLGLFGYVGLAQSHRSFAMGDDMFMFVYGSYDLKQEFINFDKVQFVTVKSGPIQRRFGLAECSVSLMSSVGSKTITSGLFRPEDLEKVGETVMSRIRDGSYDYRRYY